MAAQSAAQKNKRGFVVNTTPQFSVQHRVREVFDVQPEVRSFSLGMAAEQVSRNEQKGDTMLETFKTCEEAEKNAELPQEDLEGLLGKVNFRLNDVAVPTVGQNGKAARKAGKGEKGGNTGRWRSGTSEQTSHKSQSKSQKDTIASVHELLTESAVKEDLLAQLSDGVRPKAGSNKGKGVRKKENKDNIIDLDSSATLSSTQIRSKLTTVQQFKGSRSMAP